MKTKRAHTEYGGSYVAEKSDAVMIKLLGGVRDGSVALTTDQVRRLANFYGFDLSADNHPLIRSGNGRELIREARTDGLRIMAFLAKHGLLEEGEDPVTSLARSLDQDLFSTIPDIWNEEEE